VVVGAGSTEAAEGWVVGALVAADAAGDAVGELLVVGEQPTTTIARPTQASRRNPVTRSG
jgi:hypothetical protein